LYCARNIGDNDEFKKRFSAIRGDKSLRVLPPTTNRHEDTTTMKIWLLLAALFRIHAAEIGTPHSTVIKLTGKNFENHIRDPANGLWLLKFYAPW
jgi:hypothetical protein